MPGADASAALRAASTSLYGAYARKTQGSDSLGKDDFLKLMMAQMTHQDPLNPMDSKGMMNQLTAMGSLEQLMNINKGVDRLNKVQGDIARSSAFSFLDKDVTARGGLVKVTDGNPPGMQYSIPRDAESVQVFVSDANGKPVRTLDLGAQGPGSHSVTWDVRDDKGKPVPDGPYHYTVSAVTSDKQELPVQLYTRGKVSGLRFENGHHMLKVNGENVDIKDVVEMSNRSQHVYGARAPKPLRQELQPRPPALKRRH